MTNKTSIGTSFSGNEKKNDQCVLTISSISSKLENLALTPHEPIRVINNNNFTDYGFPGSGTEENPYIIENYNITITEGNGILIEYTSKNFVIRNCFVKTTYHGHIVVNSALGAKIVNNYCDGNSSNVGIYVSDSPNVEVIKNTCVGNISYGISVLFSNEAIVNDNTCTNTGLGIRLHASNEAIVTNNTCTDNEEGIQLTSSTGVTAANNVCNDSNVVPWGGYGFWIMSLDGSIVTNNTCTNNRHGIILGNVVSSTSEVTISNNTCTNNTNGIFVQYSDYCYITYNIIQENEEDGICVYYSPNTEVIKNTCIDNENGIMLDSSNEVVITENTSTNNINGIKFYKSDSCYITHNLIQENDNYGINLTSTNKNNIIHHNSFIDNNMGGTSQAYDSGTDNIWYEKKTREGNYWSDWDSEKPYPIDGFAESTDRYPLNESLEKISYETIILLPSIFLIAIVYRCKLKKRNSVKS